MSNPEFVHSPPSYESTLRNDQKISQSLQQDELKKAPLTGDEHADWKQTKEYLSFQHTACAEIPVLPLRIQKRAPASTYGGTRGPRPLPPCPVDAKVSSIHGKEIPHLKAVMESKMRGEYTEEDLPPAPPPFVLVGPSLDGPPYVGVGATPPTTSSFPNPFQPSFDSSCGRHGSYPSQLSSSFTELRNEPLSRRGRYSVVQGAAGDAKAQGRTQGARLTFDPSIAYIHDHQYGDSGGSRAMDAVSLYSHAVSSHIQRTPANSETRYPHIRSANRSSSRPFSSNFDSRVHGRAGSMSRQSTPTPSTSPSTPWHPPSHPPPMAGATLGPRRWASSEHDITAHIYRD
ncbi:hypothetical protein EV401DRAFT_1982203 [Pisolithus croceorrhizus]|nr:hypothetical protein EV401DRAFT_1982203 [Pisolithus croceorrhizus]